MSPPPDYEDSNESVQHQAAAIEALLLERILLDESAGIDRSRAEYADLFPGFERQVFEVLDGHVHTSATARPAAGGLGPYTIDERIGVGGQGTVYRARDTRDGRIVAIKVLHRVDSRAQARFRREAEAAARLQHPGIARVFEFDVDRGVPYLVMEHVEGNSLASWIGDPSTRESAESDDHVGIDVIRTATEFIIQIARALATAHGSGIVHRDVKPANIILTVDGRAVITDFGLARDASTASSQALTMSGDLVGTPAYMAPEQVDASVGVIGPATDVWAMGVSLYECTTLRRPFASESTRRLLEDIATAAPVPPRRHNPHIPRDLERVISTALQKAPAHRYSTSSAFADDLAAALEGHPIAARRRWFARPVPSRIHRWLVLGAALLLTLGTVWTASALAESREALARTTATELRTALAEFADLLDPGRVRALDRQLANANDYAQAPDLRPTASLVTLHSDPPGASTSILDARTGRTVSRTPEGPSSTRLPEGSYLATFVLDGHLETRYPFVVRRLGAGAHEADAMTRHDVALPRAHEHGPEWVPVPAGWSLTGEALAWTFSESFLMARHEVTVAEWIRFLDSDWLADHCRNTEHEFHSFVPTDLQKQQDGSWKPGTSDRHASVDGVSRDAIDTFVAWKNDSLPREARWWYALPSATEWERAARGADGRAYVWGNTFEPRHAALLTGRRSTRSARAVDVNPLGIRDLAGSVRELTRDHWERGLEFEAAMGGAWTDVRPENLQSFRRRPTQNRPHADCGVRLIRRFAPTRIHDAQLATLPFLDRFQGERAPAWITHFGSLWHRAAARRGERHLLEDGCLTLVGGTGSESTEATATLPLLLPSTGFAVRMLVRVVRKSRRIDLGRGFRFSIRSGVGPSSSPLLDVLLLQDRLGALTESGVERAEQRRSIPWREGRWQFVDVEVHSKAVEVRIWGEKESRPATSQLAMALPPEPSIPRVLQWRAMNFAGIRVSLREVAVRRIGG